MSHYVVSERARSEILEIVLYTATNSPAAALRLRTAFYAAFERLSKQPGMGSKREDLTDLEVRFWPIERRYMVCYTGHKNHVEIVRVFGPGRDIKSLLG